MAKPWLKELKFELYGLAIITLALLGMASLFTPAAGTVGHFLARSLTITAGSGRYLLPVALFCFGIKVMRERKVNGMTSRAWGLLILLISTLTFLHLFIPPDHFFRAAWQGQGGGLVGAAFSYLLHLCFGVAGSYILLAFLSITGLVLLTGQSPARLLGIIVQAVRNTFQHLGKRLSDFLFEEVEQADTRKQAGSPALPEKKDNLPLPQPTAPAGETETQEQGHQNRRQQKERRKQNAREQDGMELTETEVAPCALADGRPYRLPPSGLLAKPKPRDNSILEREIAEKKQILEETLASFNIQARVTQVSVGPAITRYEIQPPAGIKVSRIVGLADDIALAMAAPGVRIEAPIPGKAAVGIEVPNREIATVQLRELLESREFTESPSRLTVVLGRDIAGAPVIADLGKMPHLLVAGATGSGKSVCINTLIASILFKATPDEVKFLMIDPKMVELTTYNGIPHLVSPVVTDAKKAAGVLRWAVKEMERRYELFARTGVRDIKRYNELFWAAGKKSPANTASSMDEPTAATAQAEGPLPFVVIIIDELADLMMVAPADVEDSICRLAQMARAAGLHLVVATQRPSVDVITGLIKANIPSRISFAVSSQMDSRTILDMGGAEKLLGKGDMLFFPVGAPKPMRVQGAYLSDQEVENLTSFLREQAQPVYDQRVMEEPPVEEEEEARMEEEDELLPQAVKILIENGNASISMLQRRLHIGYARAARLIDIMEQRGIVGKFEGSKPRAILMTMEQYQQMFGRTG
ncbi:FtsK/SpoIIIE family DNA translocase [Desulfofundulus thermosubterraneus]|uniref:DNA segregation ATPase FtsK/SpoIIIE, S-DNA-T family n=1 Tax=Desulfofundulus thermosubterraneus DSM 16057 TaxID=1121432 RepID=A0A1M6BB59_9FIRM|nr:DNA translocase FtsK [Desulfofundulus thermosubterraneus]SHI45955.1 DNA segregation ATPase FtsK/SpoIIIE, S-DNA-T family [Desulfofundulus thermosubterraneus DSM 16057]